MFEVMKYILIIFICYLFLGNIIPYLIKKNISLENKKKLDEKKYLNNRIGPDKIALIENSHDGFNVKIALLKESKKRVDIVYHIIEGGLCANRFIIEILNAASRGVKVRIITNGKSGTIKKEYKETIKLLNNNKNIKIYRYSILNILKPWSIQTFIHDKFMIVDNQYLLLGGRNIVGRFYGPAHFNKNIAYDREVLINNNKNIKYSIINEINNYFNFILNSKDTKLIKKTTFFNKKKLEKRIDLAKKFDNENSNLISKNLQYYLNSMNDTNKITLLHNPVNTSKKEPWIGYQLKKILLNTKNKIIIQSPYATGNKLFLNTLFNINVSNKIYITNSSLSTPNIIAFSNYLFHRKKYMNTNFKIYEYQSHNSSIHAKSILVDERLSIVGTFNMDDRSLYIDTETMLVIDSKDFNKKLENALNKIFEKSSIVNRNPSYKDISLKLTILKLVGLFTRLIQFLI